MYNVFMINHSHLNFFLLYFIRFLSAKEDDALAPKENNNKVHKYVPTLILLNSVQLSLFRMNTELRDQEYGRNVLNFRQPE